MSDRETTAKEFAIKKSGAEVDATGSEFRCDPLTGRWALIAEGRGARPTNLTPQDDAPIEEPSKPAPDSFCPFCPGSESMTPSVVLIGTRREVENGEIDGESKSCARESCDGEKSDETESEIPRFVFRDATVGDDVDGLRWNVRVFENKWPAFRPGDFSGVETARALDCARGVDASVGLFFQSFPGYGRHEVVVDVERHAQSWSEFSEVEIEIAFRALQLRLRALRDGGEYAYSFFFKNVGADAGASQGHSHCQLTATKFLPPDLRAELERLIRYERGRRERGESARFWDALLDAELTSAERIVATTDRFVALCPFASRFPMEVEICPRFDGAFEDFDEETLAEEAILTRDLVVALENAKRKIDPKTAFHYNVVMKNAPTILDADLAEGVGLYRPRVTILPSLVKKAGYEWGSGVYINPVAPETAAEILREEF